MGLQGVGFAMPANIIANVYNMLISPDHKVRSGGSIGISFQEHRNPPLSAASMASPRAASLVATVTPNGPAAKGRRQARTTSSFPSTASPSRTAINSWPTSPPARSGSSVELGVLRNGTKQSVNVAIADRAKLFADVGNQNDDNAAPVESDAGEGKLGITVTALPSSVSSKLGIKGGVIVASVRPGSFADEINLTKGTVIVEINKHAITDEASYRSIVSGLKSGD